MSMKSIARSGAEGNTRLQKMYGAGSTPPRQDYPKGYATGGAVKDYAGGGMVAPDADGMAAKPNLGRPGRKMAKGKSGKSGKGTNVNVVIMPKPDAPKAPADMAAPPPAMMGPAPMPPPAAGPGGPPPPMPMRAKGGRVQDVRDGDEGQTQGAESGAMKLVQGRKAGGTVNAEKHTAGQDTSAEREAMSVLTGKKEGGPVLKMQAGAGGGKGRMEKIAKQKRA